MVLGETMHQLSIRLLGGGPYGLRLSGGAHQPLTVAKVWRTGWLKK